MVTLDPGPQITLEARYGLPAVWVDLTCDVFGIRYQVGRQAGGPQSWFSVVPAGEMVVDLDNASGRYSAFSGSGDLVFGEGTIMRLRCEWQGQHHSLFVGQVEQWREVWTDEVDKVVITCVDPLGVLAEQGGTFEWVPGKAGQTVRARLEQLLNRAGVRGEPFYSDQGDITCIAPKVANQSVLNEIHLTATSDMGVFFHEPAPIVDPADAGAHVSQWVYIDRRRFASVPIVLGANLPTTPVPTTADDWREVDGPLDRTVGAASRPAQAVVPVYSDACWHPGDTFHGYTDIEWAYVAYERPSLVVVSNAQPIEERDPNGNARPLPWVQYSAQAAVNSLRHRIVQLSDLRFQTQAQANALAAAVAKQLGSPKLEVTSLRLWPHAEPGQFETFLALRQQDHLMTVRNLVHGGVLVRVIVDSLIEGMEVTLIPRPGWAQGDHVAEWDIRLALTPVSSDIEDGTQPPVVDPTPGDVYVLAEEGQTAGAPALPTGFDGSNLRLSYSTTGDPTEWVYAELTNIATGSVIRLDTPVAAEGAFDIGGGRWAVTRLFPASTLFAGNAYRVRVIEAIATPPDASNYTIVNKPLPTPPTPTIVNQPAWEKATYNYNLTTETATSIEWPTEPGVRYQVGWKVGHGAGTYTEEPVQAGNLWSGSFSNDTDYAVAIRYVSGGVTSPWSTPLKLRMGHPQNIIESPLKMLVTSGDINVGPGADFTATVPLIVPPPNGAGDGQWGHNVITFNPNYAGNINGFIGTLVKEMRVRAENYNPARVTEPFGGFLTIPAYAVVTAEVHNGQRRDDLPTNVPNPTWTGSNFTQGFWKRVVNGYVCDKDALTRNGKFGIRGVGFANTSVPIRIRGQVEVWGQTYTAVARLSNKVIP